MQSEIVLGLFAIVFPPHNEMNRLLFWRTNEVFAIPALLARLFFRTAAAAFAAAVRSFFGLRNQELKSMCKVVLLVWIFLKGKGNAGFISSVNNEKQTRAAGFANSLFFLKMQVFWKGGPCYWCKIFLELFAEGCQKKDA